MSSTTGSPSRKQHRLPAAYYRGGTSRAVMFQTKDLPSDKAQWAPIFRNVLGSPDPLYGRQLDGLGGGTSSLSKVCVVGPPTVADADVDYTLAAVGVRDDDVDYGSNCGNMSAAVGPFAVDSGLVAPPRGVPASREQQQEEEMVVVRIHNTNTGKIIHATFPVVQGEAFAGDEGTSFATDGVAGTAPPVRLDFLNPGGSRTGKLLPTGNATDDLGGTRATCIDVGNPCVFVEAEALVGPMSTLRHTLAPGDIEKDEVLMRRLEAIRREAGVRMGLAETQEGVPGSVPKISMVWTPRPAAAAAEENGDICVRALSVGQPHKAVPVTVGLSLAAAARLSGTVVHQCAVNNGESKSLAICHPTGTFVVDAKYNAVGHLESAAVFRTARRLMEGTIFWKR